MVSGIQIGGKRAGIFWGHSCLFKFCRNGIQQVLPGFVLYKCFAIEWNPGLKQVTLLRRIRGARCDVWLAERHFADEIRRALFGCVNALCHFLLNI